MAQWALVQLVTHTDAAEAMSFHLTEMGAAGVSAHQAEDEIGTSRITIRGYFPIDDEVGIRAFEVRARLEELREYGLQIEPARVSVQIVSACEWETNWRSFFPPRRFGGRLLVTPSWEPIPDDAPPAVVLLDPGMAFGTGGHASTQLCLEALARLDLTGKRVADIGTGSGILAIAAVKLGAASVRAVDADDSVVPIATANCQRNDLGDRVRVTAGTIDDVTGRYDVLLMNILARVILPALPQIAERLTDDGVAILSGITDAEAPEVASGIEAAGLRIAGRPRQEGWAAFVVRR